MWEKTDCLSDKSTKVTANEHVLQQVRMIESPAAECTAPNHTERLLHTREQQSSLAHLSDVAACRYITSPSKYVGMIMTLQRCLCPAKQKQEKLQILSFDSKPCSVIV